MKYYVFIMLCGLCVFPSFCHAEQNTQPTQEIVKPKENTTPAVSKSNPASFPSAFTPTERVPADATIPFPTDI